MRLLWQPMGARVFCRTHIAECGKLSRGNLRKIKCRMFRKLPLIAFPHSAAENSTFPRIAKLPFARIVQLMCSQSTATSGVPWCLLFAFFVVHLPKNRVVFFTISINFKVCSTFQVSHHFAGQCDWLQVDNKYLYLYLYNWCDSCRDDRRN